jgi:hypothetical protein
MVFVDIGYSEGYVTQLAARLVGLFGEVLAADINANAVAALREYASVEGLTNLYAEVKEAEETVVCAGCRTVPLPYQCSHVRGRFFITLS